MLVVGQPAPWFHAPALGGSTSYSFDTVAGRWVMMLFLGNAGPESLQVVLRLVAGHRDLFDDDRACFFGVAVDPGPVDAGLIRRAMPGIRWFLDYDRTVSATFGAVEERDGEITHAPHWLLLDPMLRVRSRAPLDGGGEIMAELRRTLAIEAQPSTAPVLQIPNVFSPELCRHLISLYDQHGGQESGFMCDVDGVTTALHDHRHKRRADYNIEDRELIQVLKSQLALILNPMIRRAFQFKATRVERWLVARYDAAEGGHFRAHRDNTTAGTAHRKFACTINLNADEYEGGDLCFPEFGRDTYRAPTGGAVVFSCSLLHEARPVTKGKRYAFLPFLYDDEGARVRERNLTHVAPNLQSYRSGLPRES